MKSNAPEELKAAVNEYKLSFNNLVNHPEWVEYLEDDKAFIMENCAVAVEMNEWLHTDIYDIPEVVENFMVLLFEENIKSEMKMGYLEDFEGKEHVMMGLFRERNPELFFDDLPYCNIVATIEERALTMDDVFNLSEEEKELLKDKDLAMGFDIYEYQHLFSVLGSKVEDFELYKKYIGILDIVEDNIKNEAPVENVVEKEELIKRLFLENVGKRSTYRYTTEVADEFKEEHPEFFLDEDVPKELKDVFYNSGTSILGTDRLDFSDLKKNPEYIPYLKGKDIRHCMGWPGEYDDFFDFCEDQDLAMELGLKYGNYVAKIPLDGVFVEDKEAEIAKYVYSAIIYQCYNYDEDMPDYFKKTYPQLFLDENAPDELKEKYYTKKVSRKSKTIYGEIEYLSSDWDDKQFSFDFIKENPDYVEFLVGKELKPTLNEKYEKILEICDGNAEKFLALGIEYGDILAHPQLNYRIGGLSWELLNRNPDIDELKNSFDKLIGDAIREKDLLAYNDELPLRLQYKYPDVFLLPEELEVIKASIDSYEKDKELDTIKEKFYKRCISFRDLYLNDALKEIIKYKDINHCMDFYKAGEFFKKFSEVLGGDIDKAYNIAINKYSTQLTSILYGYIASDNIDKVIEFYKQTKFIPHPAVFNKLPVEMIRGFALNKNLWAELMKMEEYNSNDEYIGSLLELAIVMGVFETREFKKNGKIMLQGAGEEGYKKLQELINYVPEYIELFDFEDYADTGKYVFVSPGYFKFDNDYADALRDRKVQITFNKLGLIDELKEGILTDYDMNNAIENYMDESEIKEFFRRDTEGKYQYVLDKNSNAKVQKLLKTVGIKQDRWLTQNEFDLIKSCNGEFVARAFVKEGEKYRFNITKENEKYVIGGELGTTELQSRDNKKLFDYVRFLMQEYSMEEEALSLAANIDRSKIDLILDDAQMVRLLDAAEWVVEKSTERYKECDLCKLMPEQQKHFKFVSPMKLHQLFDGLELEYTKEFRDFILENKFEIMEDWEFIGLFKDFQIKLKELLQDPDYANIKITPEVLVKALVPVENQYSNKRSGFEKGEELASKFSFSQEYFDHAQQIWNEARKRNVSSIPRVQGIEENNTYEVLRLDDAEGVFIGNLTDCCQRLGGAGETSMLHSMTEKNGRVFVIRDNTKRIIAQSWLWRNGNTICFDNVEIPDRAKNDENEKAIYRIMKNVAKELCDKDRIELDRLVEEGKISRKKADELKAMKVTVGKGHNDIYEITNNRDRNIEDLEIKRPIESDKAYKGITSKDRLYISDSNHQVILYQADDYISSDITLPIHTDKNEELSYNEMKYKELKMMKSIIKEVEGECKFETREDLLKQYQISEDELRLIQGTDWFMLYSENENTVNVHKMLKSPTSGIIKKSIREQKEAVEMILNKGKSISMAVENDRVYRAAKNMIKHMQKRYTMKVVDEENRMVVSSIQSR